MRNKASLPRNPVAKNLYTFNKPSVVDSKQRKLKSEAILRDARELLSESLFDSETKGFDGYSVDLWVLDEMSEVIHEENACLGCIGCSSIEVDFEED